MKVQCQDCGAVYDVPPGIWISSMGPCSKCGKRNYKCLMKIRCRSCGAMFDLPEMNLEDIGDCTACGKKLWEIVENTRLHPCPDCGQVISRYAGSCPHCGAWFRNDLAVTVTHVKPPFREILNVVFQVLVSLFLIGLIPVAIVVILVILVRCS